jgi:hypothetical protein
MKVFIIQEASRKEINQKYRESLCLQRAFERVGHEAVVWGIGYENFNTHSLERASEDCDVLLLLEQYTLFMVPSMHRIAKPKVFWSIDSHLNLKSHLETVNRNLIDGVLCSCMLDVEKFENTVSTKIKWFPNAYPNDLIFPDDSEKTINIGYCGSNGNIERTEFIKRLKSDIGMISEIHYGDNMVNFIRRCKIHFNMNIRHDLNYRIFETTGAGTMLIVNNSPGLDVLFKVGTDIIVYRDYEDCLSVINYYLKNDSLRQRVAENGHKTASRMHTYDKRAEQFVSLCKEWFDI